MFLMKTKLDMIDCLEAELRALPLCIVQGSRFG